MINTLRFYSKNWKLGTHLLFRTKRFGVNNKWWSEFDSIFGWPLYKKIYAIITIKPLIDNFKGMWFRSTACYFMTDKELKDSKILWIIPCKSRN